MTIEEETAEPADGVRGTTRAEEITEEELVKTVRTDAGPVPPQETAEQKARRIGKPTPMETGIPTSAERRDIAPPPPSIYQQLCTMWMG